MSTVTGTFSGTGQSSEVTGRTVDIKMDFAGTASVDIEEKMPSGAWIKIETGVTADYRKIAEFATPSHIRLNCTAHTNDVEYLIKAGS